MDYGRLRVALTSRITSVPIEGATVQISYTGVPENILEELEKYKKSLIYEYVTGKRRVVD
mgnify:CR=1 FL=1